MKLYIHDKCLEKLFDIPKSIAKKVLEFQQKFKENSRADSINLESIKSFKDPMLRTARIDQKYRAIIRVPASGDSYHMLWVDNHDEAMDWAKNKVFEWNEMTQTAQIFTAADVIESLDIPNANTTKALFEDYAEDNLMQIGVPHSLMKLVLEIKSKSDLESLEKHLPVDTYENLFYLSEGIDIFQLIADIGDGTMSAASTDDKFASINNQRSFVLVDDELMQEVINGELSKWQVFLHPSQRKLVESNFKGTVKVTGGAGTGKTVVALHRLKYLTTHRPANEQRKVLFTTFTNALTTNLLVQANQLHIDKNKYLLTNIDALLKNLALTEGLIDQSTRVFGMFNEKNSQDVWDEIADSSVSAFSSSFLHGEYQNVILYNDINDLESYLRTSRLGRGKPITRKQKMELWSLVEIYNQYKNQHGLVDRSELFNKVANHFTRLSAAPFSNIIADEVQDLSNVELRFLRSLVHPSSNDLFLVGDPFQKIYARKLNFSSAGIQIRGNRSRQLRINYRTSEEIKRLAVATVKDLQYDDFDDTNETLAGYLSLFHGDKPLYLTFDSKSEEHAFILNKINILLEIGLKHNDIVVGFRTKDALKDLKNFLHKQKVPYNDSTSLSSNDRQGIVLATFHGFKGLEFKAVFLSDVSQATCPLLFHGYQLLENHEKQDHLNSEKSLLYVAMTRAINHLTITGIGTKSDNIPL